MPPEGSGANEVIELPRQEKEALRMVAGFNEIIQTEMATRDLFISLHWLSKTISC
jgi:hypothetical protein